MKKMLNEFEKCRSKLLFIVCVVVVVAIVVVCVVVVVVVGSKVLYSARDNRRSLFIVSDLYSFKILTLFQKYSSDYLIKCKFCDICQSRLY